MKNLSRLAAALAVTLIAVGSTSAQQATSLQARVQTPKPNGIPAGGPYVPAGTLFDNEQSDGSTSLASQDSSGTFTARSADDFTLTTPCTSGEFAISRIRVQMVQADAAPQPFAVDLFNDNGSGTAPAAGITPFTTLTQTSQTLLGAFGAGTSIFEASFDTPGLVLDAGTRYWISGYGATAASNPSGFNNFFAASAGATGSTDNGQVIAPGAGVTAWTPVEVVVGGAPLAFSFAIDGACALPAESDLSITKTTATTGPVVQGGNVAFALGVSNAGPAAATGVVVTDTLPSGLAFQSSTCGASAVGQVVTWTVGALANGANAACGITARVLRAGVITNTATVTADNADTATANNTASSAVTGTLPVQAPMLSGWSLLALLGGTFLIAGLVFRRR